jgi:hypothetical protein
VRGVGKQVYLSESDIAALTLLESVFSACVSMEEGYEDEERMKVQKLYDKVFGEGFSTVGFKG